ncbi:MAG: hypothetical protein SOV61_00240, partial [Lachnospiraceae bacterium]|nr:hypothetical protein [Lachnospiraceae bacterium]
LYQKIAQTSRSGRFFCQGSFFTAPFLYQQSCQKKSKIKDHRLKKNGILRDFTVTKKKLGKQ